MNSTTRRRNMMPPTNAANNLLLWLPLQYDGDLTERVSGTSIWRNSLQWDNTVNAYKFEQFPIGYYSSVGIDVNLPSAWAYRATTKRICECDLYVEQFNNYGRVCVFGQQGINGYSADNFLFLYAPGATSNGNGVVSLQQWSHIKIVQDGFDVQYYTDGILTGQITHTDNTQARTNRFVPLGARWSSETQTTAMAYLKNIKIYQL